MITVWVDDLMLFVNSESLMAKMKTDIKLEWEVTRDYRGSPLGHTVSTHTRTRLNPYPCLWVQVFTGMGRG